MEISFSPVEWAEIQPEVSRHLATLPTAIESYIEKHILESRHYRVLVGGQVAGFAAIHNEQLITQFALDDAFKRHGQAAYRALRGLELVQASLVPTCDEFWLASALDEHRQLTRQAYLFSAPADTQPVPAPRARDPCSHVFDGGEVTTDNHSQYLTALPAPFGEKSRPRRFVHSCARLAVDTIQAGSYQTPLAAT